MKQRLLDLILLERVSLDDMETRRRSGAVSQATFEAYCHVWTWLAPRFGGNAGRKHDHFWQTYGKAAYYARINRVRTAFTLAAMKP